MTFKKYDYKVAFLDAVFQEYEGREIDVLDMGSGTSKDFVEVLKKYGNVHYTGIEFNTKSQEKARQLFKGYHNVEFINSFGEDAKSRYLNYFDMTLSLSVLEHVKRLQEFLLTSIQVTKSGGKIIHRYDLGHSLHSSFYEKLKVFLCQNFPYFIPARHFTSHPDKQNIIQLLESQGVIVNEIMYSQMPNLKGMMNRMNWEREDSVKLSREIVAIERKLSRYMQAILSKEQMEYFFPAITIIGTKEEYR